MNKNFFLIIILITGYGSCNLEAAPKPMPDLLANGDSAQSSESHDGRLFFNKFIHHKASSSLKIIIPADRMKEPLLKQIFDSLFSLQELKIVVQDMPNAQANINKAQEEKLLESIREKYKKVEYAWLFSEINKKYFIAPLNKEAFQCPVAHDVLLDRIAAHIAYGRTKSKIGTISSDNPFVTKLLAAADYSEDKSYLHTPNIGAISSDPLNQKKTLEYLEKLIGQYNDHNEKMISCPVCIDPYRALAFTGKMPTIESDVHIPQLQNQKKIAINYCSHGHFTCVSCVNHPTIEVCPICRDPFGIEKKIALCQTCGIASNDLKFIYCDKCESVAVLCKKCTHMPCCRNKIKLLSYGGQNVMAYIAAIKDGLRNKFVEFIKNQQILCDNELSPLILHMDAERERHSQDLQSLLTMLCNLGNKIIEEKKDIETSKECSRERVVFLDSLVREFKHNEAILLTKMQDSENQEKLYGQAMAEVKNKHIQQVRAYQQSTNKLADKLLKMAESNK